MRKILWFAAALAMAGLMAGDSALANGGIAPGAIVRIVKSDGNSFEGRLNDMTLKDQVHIYTTQNIGVRTLLKDIRRIADTGRKVSTDYGIYSTKSSGVTVYEFVKTDGQRFEGMLSSMPVFDIDLGPLGVQKNIWLTHLRSIEVPGEGASSPSAGGQTTITCPHCGKPITVTVSPAR